MRKIERIALPPRTMVYLARKQQEVNQGQDPNQTWKAARKTKTMKEVVLTTLTGMAGSRQRCMFCEDSRGADIEHFWPKARYKRRTFCWENMLLLCSPCNRQKGDRFELDAHGKPLLIDPTAEDPWDFLFYDPHTGIIKARCDPASGQLDPKGKHTTDLAVLPINIEAVTDGRQRTQRNLRRAIHGFFDKVRHGNDRVVAEAELVETIRDNDNYGLAHWFFLRDGSRDAPFRDLKTDYPEIWKVIVESL